MDNKKTAQQELDKLKENINYHSHRYYVLDDPEVPDAEYDRMFQRLLELEKHFPELQTQDSPSRRVGAPPLEKFKEVQHEMPKLSPEVTLIANISNGKYCSSLVCTSS